MATFTAQETGVFGKAMYIAVPLRPTLTEILDSSEFKDDAFHNLDVPPHIEGRKIIVEADNSLVEVMATFAKEKGDVSHLYTIPDDGLDGTTLSISAIGKTPSSVDNIIKKMLSFFGAYIDLEMKPTVQQRFEMGFQGVVKEVSYSIPFFEQYQKIRANLSDAKMLPNKKIERGFFINLCNETLGKLGISNFQRDYDIRLVKRVEGKYQNVPLELSLVHISGPRLYPRIQGVFLYQKFESGCPSWEISTCEQAEAFAGHFLSASKLFFGGSLLLPKQTRKIYRDQESGPQEQLSYCMGAFDWIPSNSPFKQFEERLSGFASPIQVSVSDNYKSQFPNLQYGVDITSVPNTFAQEQIDTMRRVIRVVYDSFNRR
ncbi:hypothetical protein HY636_02725 [Candidatus Woesearchaeota archaeon]|nr:hypothetical protein [Candidatus Woesearchaeota archaeon]